MDDVLLLETRPEEKQELLNITNKVADKYCIKFRREKPNSDNWEHQRKTAIHTRTDDTGPDYHIQVPRGNDKW